MYDLFIDKELNVAFERFQGEITMQDFIGAIQESAAHPDWVAGKDLLTDLREAQLSLSYDEMTMVVESIPASQQIDKNAIVVRRDMEYGMARMFEMLSEKTVHWNEYRIFRDMDEAKQWLGIGHYANPAIKWLI